MVRRCGRYVRDFAPGRQIDSGSESQPIEANCYHVETVPRNVVGIFVPAPNADLHVAMSFVLVALQPSIQRAEAAQLRPLRAYFSGIVRLLRVIRLYVPSYDPPWFHKLSRIVITGRFALGLCRTTVRIESTR